MRPTNSPISKTHLTLHYITWLLVFVFSSLGISAHTQTDSNSAPRLQWSKTAGVSQYRLQIASDEKFRDVLIDTLVNGEEYVPTDLAAGEYYWRVAPSANQTGRFQPVNTFRIQPRAAVTSKPVTPKIYFGWSTAMGLVNRVMMSSPEKWADIITVNSDGSLYAIDPNFGVPRWVVRPAKSVSATSLVLFVIKTSSDPLVVFAVEKGLRAVEARKGREVWTTQLESDVLAALVSDSFSPQMIYVLESRNGLVIIDAAKGTLRKRVKIYRQPLTLPVLLPDKGILIPVRYQSIEFRNLEGELVRTIELGSEITSAPVLIDSSRGVQVLVGTRKGIAVIDGVSLQVVGQISLEAGDYTVGSLVRADINGDDEGDILAVTKGHRLIAFDVSGKILWSKPNPSGMSPVLGDVDDNGQVDVVTLDERGLAVALSGVDGSVIWESDATIPGEKMTPHAVVKTPDGRVLLIGADSAGLRAIEIPRSSFLPVSK